MSTATIETAQENQLEVFGPNFIEFPDSGLKVDCAVITVNDKDGQAHEIAAVYGLTKGNYWEFAEYIVCAVNNQKALIDALKNILADCETAQERRTSADLDFATYHAIEYARAALAQVTKQTPKEQGQ